MRSVLPALLPFALCASPAAAQHVVEVAVVETVDIAMAQHGGADGRARLLDNLDLLADADLDRLIGWKGATAHIHVLNNLGEMPNDAAATLQGVNNIEVASQRLRLFEAWIEQRLDEATTLRAGLYDLNSEFYANDAAGLLIAPAFGVGSEIAATGPNGPSIFPSTALGVRIDRRLGTAGYVRAAVLNAAAGTLGDPGGVDLRFRHGALAIAEAGLEGEGRKLAFGYWRYTDRQDDAGGATDAAGAPIRHVAQGGYLLAEARIAGSAATRALTGFVRAGMSDGRTTSFRGGWQAGLLVERAIPGRPDAALSFGANQGFTTAGYRRTLRDDGLRPAQAETAFELTYSDRLAPWLTVQPDVQVILDREGDAGAPVVVMTTLRLTLSF